MSGVYNLNSVVNLFNFLALDEQFKLKRLADAIIDIHGMSAVLSR